MVPRLVRQQPPPPDYYAGNLRYLLDEVVRRSGGLLEPGEQAFVAAFRDAGVPAQRLFARLVSRGGRWLRTDSLNYPEVDDVAAALERLCAGGLAERTPAAPADELLPLLTRAELAEVFPTVRASTKPRWIQSCLARYPDTLIRSRVARRHPWVGLACGPAFTVCRVLFFGGDGQDLSTFVVQDLGIRRYERYPLGPLTRPFRDRRELDRYLLCRSLAVWSRQIDDWPALAPVIRRALWPQARSRAEQRSRDGILNRLGRWHERRGELADALECYGRSTSHPARERQARVLRRLADEAGVAGLLAAMDQEPWAPEEQDFAVRFASRRRRFVSPVSVCQLSGSTPRSIEFHAVHLLCANGGRGWHLENLLPLGLAGLAFWDEIFAAVQGAFSHPFQLGPRDLFWPDFARARRPALAARSRLLLAPGGLEAQLRRIHASRCGTANRLVHWPAMSQALLDALLLNVPHEVLANLAIHTVHNLHRCRSGFPDLLMIYGRGAWELVEVKGPGDQLQPTQRVWLEALDQLEVPARVLRFKSGC